MIIFPLWQASGIDPADLVQEAFRKVIVMRNLHFDIYDKIVIQAGLHVQYDILIVKNTSPFHGVHNFNTCDLVGMQSHHCRQETL